MIKKLSYIKTLVLWNVFIFNLKENEFYMKLVWQIFLIYIKCFKIFQHNFHLVQYTFPTVQLLEVVINRNLINIQYVSQILVVNRFTFLHFCYMPAPGTATESTFNTMTKCSSLIVLPHSKLFGKQINLYKYNENKINEF